MRQPVLIYSTFPDAAAAEAVAERLLRDGLAACVNMIPGMRSLYMWQGAMESAEEIVFLVKTTEDAAEAAMAAIARHHPYDEPALLVLPTAGGAPSFCDWIRAQVPG